MKKGIVDINNGLRCFVTAFYTNEATDTAYSPEPITPGKIQINCGRVFKAYTPGKNPMDAARMAYVIKDDYEERQRDQHARVNQLGFPELGPGT